MKRKSIGRKTPKDCPQGIGSQGIETWMVQQTLHAFESIRPWHGCLHGKPGIQNHRLVLPTALECLGCLGPLLTKDRLKGPQPGPRQRHGWPGHGLEGLLPCHGITRCSQPAPCHGRELALTLPLRPCRVPSQSRTGQQTGQRLTKRRTKTLPQRENGTEQSRWIHRRLQRLQFSQTGHGQQGREFRLLTRGHAVDPLLKRANEGVFCRFIRLTGRPCQQHITEQRLRCIPSAERVIIGRQQQQRVRQRTRLPKHNRC